MDNNNLIGFFNSINSEEVLKSFIKSKTKENLNLEFKQKQDSRNGNLGENDKFNFSKALSGFANSGGGVLIWGIETRKKDESAKRLKPINKVDDFIKTLKSSLLNTVQPFVDDVRIEKIEKEKSKNRGYVKCLIPLSDKTPHRALLAGRDYYKRSTEGFYRLTHYDLEDMFGRRQKPLLFLITDLTAYEETNPDIRAINFAFRNDGRAIAKYFGFFCKFNNNVELIGSPNLSIKDVSKINGNKPAISYSDNIDVIHPNNIVLSLGSMRFKRKDKTKKIEAVITYYCDGMLAKTKNLSFD